MNKTASIRVRTEVLPQVIGPLNDHGLTVIGSRNSRYEGEVVLVIEGNCLPEDCASHPHEVKLFFTQENYGSQKIIRVSEITLVQKTALAA